MMNRVREEDRSGFVRGFGDSFPSVDESWR